MSLQMGVKKTAVTFAILTIFSTALLVSGCASVKKSYSIASSKKKYASSRKRSPSSLETSEHDFIWPVGGGRISSYFGKRKRNFHDGIDITAPRGTDIKAAKDGTVLYSSRRIRGYGNMIVLKHYDGTATVYAHNQKNLVAKGDEVKQGDLIAKLGNTGKSTGPHLHFEVRKGEDPVDPVLYLPPFVHSTQAKN